MVPMVEAPHVFGQTLIPQEFFLHVIGFVPGGVLVDTKYDGAKVPLYNENDPSPGGLKALLFPLC